MPLVTGVETSDCDVQSVAKSRDQLFAMHLCWDAVLLLITEILHYHKDPKLWELWCIPYCGVMQDLYHQPSFWLSWVRQQRESQA